jgi:hypothetical protein
MKRPILISAACALALASVPFFLTGAATTGGAPPCVNQLRHEPVVVYEVSGFGLGGFFDQALTVYGDGSVRLARSTLDGVGSSSRWIYVGQEAAVDFARNLANLGARELCDQPSVVSDLPLTTLTVIGPQTDARAHTASWWYPETPQLQAIQQRIDTFICTHFGGPNCGS